MCSVIYFKRHQKTSSKVIKASKFGDLTCRFQFNTWNDTIIISRAHHLGGITPTEVPAEGVRRDIYFQTFLTLWKRTHTHFCLVRCAGIRKSWGVRYALYAGRLSGVPSAIGECQKPDTYLGQVGLRRCVLDIPHLLVESMTQNKKVEYSAFWDLTLVCWSRKQRFSTKLVFGVRQQCCFLICRTMQTWDLKPNSIKVRNMEKSETSRPFRIIPLGFRKN